MAETREIHLEVDKDEFRLLLVALEGLTVERIAAGLPAKCAAIDDLRA